LEIKKKSEKKTKLSKAKKKNVVNVINIEELKGDDLLEDVVLTPHGQFIKKVLNQSWWI